MAKMNKQTQKSGDHSQNIQTENLTIINNDEARMREIANEVYDQNVYKLAGVANDIANIRKEEITGKILDALRKQNPTGFKRAQDPSFQYALFTVQKEYAKNGDSDLGDLLVDLLVDCSKQEQRDILQIVLSESLEVASKLTKEQLAVLAIIFLFKYTQCREICNHVQLGTYFDNNVKPFAQSIVKGRTCYQHLEFSGCGSTELIAKKLEEILGTFYQGLFINGFDSTELDKIKFLDQQKQKLVIPCLNDNKKFQINAINLENLKKKITELKIPEDEQAKIVKLFDLNKMTEAEIKEKCIKMRSYMENVFDVWSSSPMNRFSLTSVGVAIGHANIKRFVGEFTNLSIWIN